MQDAETYQAIQVEKRGQTDWVTLNRPDRLKAVNHRTNAPWRHNRP